MAMRCIRPFYRHARRRVLLSTALLLLAFLLPGSSSAQGTLNTPSTRTPLRRTPAVDASMKGIPISSRAGTRVSMTTLFTTFLAPNSTKLSSTPTLETPNQPRRLFPNGDTTSLNRRRNENVFNYYFLFLAAFALVIVVGLWSLHRRRKRRKEERRLHGQDALARDLDQWVNTRRWIHGAWRPTASVLRREEGFNEHGEVPPPYQPKSEDTLVVQGSIGTRQDSTSGLTMPLRTLPRNEIERGRPPGYEEAASHNGISSARPDTATTQITRKDSVDRNVNSSTRDLAVHTAQSRGGHTL